MKEIFTITAEIHVRSLVNFSWHFNKVITIIIIIITIIIIILLLLIAVRVCRNVSIKLLLLLLLLLLHANRPLVSKCGTIC